MIPSTVNNSSMSNNNKKERKRRSVSLNNSKKISRTNFLPNSNDEQIYPNNFKSINHSDEKNAAEHESTANELLDQTKVNFHKTSTVVVSPIVSATDLTKSSFRSSTKVFQLLIPRTNSIKMIVNGDGLASALRTPAKIQLTKTLPIPNETNSNNQQSVLDYPLTPPPPILDHSHRTTQNHVLICSDGSSNDSKQSKRHSYSLADWSVPPTSELSPTSLPSSSPDDSLVELDLKIKSIPSVKSRYRSLSFSCLTLSNSMKKSNYKSKSLSRISQSNHRKIRSTSPVIKYSSIERLKRRRHDQQIYGKRLKIKTKSDEQIFIIIQDILNEIIEQIDDKDKTLKLFLNTPVIQFQNIIEIQDALESIPIEINNTELTRQTSTPLTFHSIPSSTGEDDSPRDVLKTHIYTDIVNELIKGAKGLDKLSCSLVNFTNSIHDFIRLTIEKQKEKIQSLLNELDKKCSSQLTRAKIFCTKKIEYFIEKYPRNCEYLDEITLIVQYFYFHVLLLNSRKQENEYELILTDLIHGKYTFINELFSSSILTSIIDDLILPSSLANEYLLSQPIVINQVEYSLPFVRNIDYENELLCKQDIALMSNPFSDLNDLEGYLNSCERKLIDFVRQRSENTSVKDLSPSIPYYPLHQSVHSSMYYPPSGQYYYPPIPSTEMSNYYYHPSYSNCQSSYGYNHHSGYYNPMTSYHEQYNYYYNQPTSYDIPMINKNGPYPAYRRVNSNVLSPPSNYPS